MVRQHLAERVARRYAAEETDIGFTTCARLLSLAPDGAGVQPLLKGLDLALSGRRLEKVAPAYHMVVHTAPSTRSKKGELAGYWKTLADDFHWHIEILPIVETKSKSYSIKETNFNAVLPEQAAEQLRGIDPN